MHTQLEGSQRRAKWVIRPRSSVHRRARRIVAPLDPADFISRTGEELYSSNRVKDGGNFANPIQKQLYGHWNHSEISADSSTISKSSPRPVPGSSGHSDAAQVETAVKPWYLPRSPVHSAAHLLCLAPVSLHKPRRLSFHPLQSTFLLCLAMYLGISVCMFRIYRELGSVLMNTSGHVNMRIYVFEQAVHLVPFFFTPASWMYGRAVKKNHKNCVSYAIQYKEVTGEEVDYKGLYSRVQLLTVLTVLAPLIGWPTAYFTLSFVPLISGPPVCFSVWAHSLNVLLCYVRICELKIAARQLREQLLKATEQSKPSAQELRALRRLWVKLRELFDSPEDPVILPDVLNFLYMFGMITLCTYVCFSLLVGGEIVIAMGQLFIMAIYSTELFFLCDASHVALAEMNESLFRPLDIISTKEMRPDVAREVALFYTTVASKPSTILLGGFVTLDRTVMKSIFSSLATYLVVLAQFRMSSDEEHPSNMTVIEELENALE